MQYRRCIAWMRTCMGRHLFCHHGPVQDSLGWRIQGRSALIFNFMNNLYGMGGQPWANNGYGILAVSEQASILKKCILNVSMVIIHWHHRCFQTQEKMIIERKDPYYLIHLHTGSAGTHHLSIIISFKGRDRGMAKEDSIIGYGNYFPRRHSINDQLEDIRREQ